MGLQGEVLHHGLLTLREIQGSSIASDRASLVGIRDSPAGHRGACAGLVGVLVLIPIRFPSVKHEGAPLGVGGLEWRGEGPPLVLHIGLHLLEQARRILAGDLSLIHLPRHGNSVGQDRLAEGVNLNTPSGVDG